MSNPILYQDIAGLKLCLPNSVQYVRDFYDDMLGISTSKNIHVNLLIALSSLESGWANEHNRSLCNLWGLTRAGGRNLSFASFAEGNEYWENLWGVRLQGSQTIDAFTSGLVDNTPKYNANPGYKDLVTKQYNYWLEIECDCLEKAGIQQ